MSEFSKHSFQESVTHTKIGFQIKFDSLSGRVLWEFIDNSDHGHSLFTQFFFESHWVNLRLTLDEWNLGLVTRI